MEAPDVDGKPHKYINPELVPLTASHETKIPSHNMEKVNHTTDMNNFSDFSKPNMEEAKSKTDLLGLNVQQPSAQQTTQKRDSGAQWKLVWYNFSQDTTLHGVNKIAERNAAFLRRIFWMLVVLTGVGLFAYQMISSLLTYYSFPMTVNVKINYNSTLTFPAVTVCNQNDFRTTATAQLGFYHMVQNYYANVATGGVNLTYYGAQDLSLEALYRTAAHRKEDMIVHCTWDETPCDMDDFQVILTDYGVCYTFNSARKGQQVRNITRTGADRGLSLRLNIEQYEYMVGPNPGAGIKLLVHENTEVPLVRDLGQAIPPGTHAYVGIQIVQVNNLEKPYGECRDDQVLKYFEYYSIPACVLECKEDYLEEHCQCRDVYMPNGTGEPPAPPVCTLEQYQSCAVPRMVDFYSPENKAACDQCSIPCQRTLYDASVTYAYSSSFDTDQQLRDTQTELRNKYLLAQETNQRVDHAARDTLMITNFNRSMSDIDVVLHHIIQDLTETRVKLKSLIEEVTRRGNFHLHWGIEKIKQALELNFVRGWEVRDERTFQQVAAGFLEISAFLERILALNSASSNETGLDSGDAWRTSLYLLAERDLYAKHVMCIHALDNITDINDAYTNADPLVTYVISPRRVYDKKYVTTFLTRTNQQKELYPKFVLRTTQIMEESDLLRSLMKQILLEGAQRQEEVTEARKRFEFAARSFLYYRFYYYETVVYAPVDEITKIINNFEDAMDNVSRDWQSVLLNLDSLLGFVGRVDEAWTAFDKARNDCIEYLKDKTKKKEPLALFFSSKEFTNHLASLEQFFNEARSRSLSLAENLKRLGLSTQYVWETMLQEETVQTFYQAIKEDIDAINNTLSSDLQDVFYKFTGNPRSWVRANYTQLPPLVNADFPDISLEDKSKELNDFFQYLIEATHFEEAVGDKDSNLFKTMDILRESMLEFIQASQINSEFFKNNFLNVDVFMKELSYQQIQQQAGYDGTSLFSDIGGSMGLFIGASVISIFELFDVIILNIFRIHLKGEQ